MGACRMLHVDSVCPVGVALVHGFVMMNMCAHACSTACVMHALILRMPQDIIVASFFMGCVPAEAVGQHLFEFTISMSFFCCMCFERLHDSVGGFGIGC